MDPPSYTVTHPGPPPGTPSPPPSDKKDVSAPPPPLHEVVAGVGVAPKKEEEEREEKREEEVYAPGTTMYGMGYKTEEEYVAAQKGIREVVDGKVTWRRGPAHVAVETPEGPKHITREEAVKLGELEGEGQFQKFMSLGLVPEGSKFVPGEAPEEWGYFTAEQAAAVEKAKILEGPYEVIGASPKTEEMLVKSLETGERAWFKAPLEDVERVKLSLRLTEAGALKSGMLDPTAAVGLLTIKEAELFGISAVQHGMLRDVGRGQLERRVALEKLKPFITPEEVLPPGMYGPPKPASIDVEGALRADIPTSSLLAVGLTQAQIGEVKAKMGEYTPYEPRVEVEEFRLPSGEIDWEAFREAGGVTVGAYEEPEVVGIKERLLEGALLHLPPKLGPESLFGLAGPLKGVLYPTKEEYAARYLGMEEGHPLWLGRPEPPIVKAFADFPVVVGPALSTFWQREFLTPGQQALGYGTAAVQAALIAVPTTLGMRAMRPAPKLKGADFGRFDLGAISRAEMGAIAKRVAMPEGPATRMVIPGTQLEYPMYPGAFPKVPGLAPLTFTQELGLIRAIEPGRAVTPAHLRLTAETVPYTYQPYSVLEGPFRHPARGPAAHRLGLSPFVEGPSPRVVPEFLTPGGRGLLAPTRPVVSGGVSVAPLTTATMTEAQFARLMSPAPIVFATSPYTIPGIEGLRAPGISPLVFPAPTQMPSIGPALGRDPYAIVGASGLVTGPEPSPVSGPTLVPYGPPVPEPFPTPVSGPAPMPAPAPIPAPFPVPAPLPGIEIPPPDLPLPELEVPPPVPTIPTTPIVPPVVPPPILGSFGTRVGLPRKGRGRPKKGKRWMFPGLQIVFSDPFTLGLLRFPVAPKRARKYGAAEVVARGLRV